MTHPQARQERLLAHLQQAGPGATVSTGEIHPLYREWGFRQRSTVRHDLRALAARGDLIQVPGHNATYRINHAQERAT